MPSAIGRELRKSFRTVDVRGSSAQTGALTGKIENSNRVSLMKTGRRAGPFAAWVEKPENGLSWPGSGAAVPCGPSWVGQVSCGNTVLFSYVPVLKRQKPLRL